MRRGSFIFVNNKSWKRQTYRDRKQVHGGQGLGLEDKGLCVCDKCDIIPLDVIEMIYSLVVTLVT